MDWSTFEKAVEVAANYSDMIALGGGEPTVHPDFMKMVRYVLNHVGWQGRYSFDNVFIATNGKSKSRVRRLIGLYEKQAEEDEICGRDERLSIELSDDVYHEAIDPEIWSWFATERRGKYGYGTYTYNRLHDGANRSVGYVGSAVDLPEAQGQPCPGCGPFEIDPDGGMYMCPHRDVDPIGHIDDADRAYDFLNALRDVSYEAGEFWYESCIHDIPEQAMLDACNRVNYPEQVAPA